MRTGFSRGPRVTPEHVHLFGRDRVGSFSAKKIFMSRSEVRVGSKCEVLIPSRCLRLCPRQQTCGDYTAMTVSCHERKWRDCSQSTLYEGKPH
jgi:hypothetical protein